MIETKLSCDDHPSGYAQGGLIAYVDGDNYVKFDAISRRTAQRASTGSSCARRWAGAIQNPTAEPTRPSRRHDQHLAAAEEGQDDLLGRVLVRRTATGPRWPARPRTPMQSPEFGLFSLRAAGQLASATCTSFDYFTLDGQDPPSGTQLQRPGRRVRRHVAGHVEVERDRASRRHDEVRNLEGSVAAEHDHGARRHLQQRRRAQTRNAPAAGRRPHPHKELFVSRRGRSDAASTTGYYAQGGALGRRRRQLRQVRRAISDQGHTKFNRDRAALEQGSAIPNHGGGPPWTSRRRSTPSARLDQKRGPARARGRSGRRDRTAMAATVCPRRPTRSSASSRLACRSPILLDRRLRVLQGRRLDRLPTRPENSAAGDLESPRCPLCSLSSLVPCGVRDYGLRRGRRRSDLNSWTW